MYTNEEQRLHDILVALYEKQDVDSSYADNALAYMNGSMSSIERDIDVRLIKGGTYRIKGYYLENNELSDIRGASAIITEVQENIVPNLLKELVGFDCILYNGGGNLFAIAPADCDTDIGLSLEQEAQKYLITAESAYYVSEPISLSALLGENYRANIAQRENELDKRKKLKMSFSPSPVSELVNSTIAGVTIEANVYNGSNYCEKCKKRIARYIEKDKLMCGGCLHKYSVGRQQKAKYIEEYKRYLNDNGIAQMNTLNDISKDRVAVVYADGNNMGGIIQSFTKLTQMMNFSATVKSTMPEIVYSAMKECGIRRFEIVAMGGDDIFMIVPGKQAVPFALRLIEAYKEQFSDKFTDCNSTLSVGVCIAKTNTPIKVMLETAEDRLSCAKELVKRENCSGSLAYTILNGYSESIGMTNSMQPFSAEQAKTILELVTTINNKKTANSKLRNIVEAYENAESIEEANLYLAYMNAKDKPEERILLPKLTGYTLNGGCYIKDGRAYTLWKELLELTALEKENG